MNLEDWDSNHLAILWEKHKYCTTKWVLYISLNKQKNYFKWNYKISVYCAGYYKKSSGVALLCMRELEAKFCLVREVKT